MGRDEKERESKREVGKETERLRSEVVRGDKISMLPPMYYTRNVYGLDYLRRFEPLRGNTKKLRTK